MMRVALVSCVKSKRAGASPARELYTSQLFTGFRALAERCDRWFILSAMHGLVEPTTVIEPYERTLATMPRHARQDWARVVCAQLELELPLGADVVIYAGERYREAIVPFLRGRGHQVEIPLEGMMIGQQLQYLSGQVHPLERLGR